MIACGSFAVAGLVAVTVLADESRPGAAVDVPPVPPSECALEDLRDEPVGDVVPTIELEQLESHDRFQVAASPDTPHIAIAHDHEVKISDDNGRTFHEIFEPHRGLIFDIAMGKGGVLYAHNGDELAVRTPDGKVQWRPMPPHDPDDVAFSQRIAVVGDALVWLHEDRASATRFAVTRDRGATWQWLGPRRSEIGNTGALRTWRGALYQFASYEEATTSVDRLDPSSGAFVQATFTEARSTEQIAGIVPSDRVGVEWTWHGRCWIGKDSLDRRACSITDAPRWQMFMMKTLQPVEGGRTLALYRGSLIQLCGDAARQIYRQFPFERVLAVDAAGHPIVGTRTAVLRWSPAHGWRRLFHEAEWPSD